MMTGCSRQVFAMARDSRFPAHQLMRRVNTRTQTPIPATILILVVGVVLMVALPGDALMELIVGGTILPALIYGAIVVLYLAVRKRLDHKEGGFSLGPLRDAGRHRGADLVGLLRWSSCCHRPSAFVPIVIVVGLLVVGGVYFAYMMVFNREVLETEPGIDIFAATPEVTE